MQDSLSVRKIQPAYRQVAEQLRQLTLGGSFEPGARLPNEAEMSAMFGVSRSTVREALRVLSSQNLVVSRRGVGGGTFVARPDAEHIAEYLESSIGLLFGADEVSVSELIDVRSCLEARAAELAAVRRTESDIEVLRETLEMERTSADVAVFEERRAFHQTVLEASGNSLLEIMARPIFSTLRTRFLRSQAEPSFWARVTAEHEAIFRHIENRDAQGARVEMENHLAALASTYCQIDRMSQAGGPEIA